MKYKQHKLSCSDLDYWDLLVIDSLVSGLDFTLEERISYQERYTSNVIESLYDSDSKFVIEWSNKLVEELIGGWYGKTN